MIEQKQHDVKLLKKNQNIMLKLELLPSCLDFQKNCASFIAEESHALFSSLMEANCPQQNWDLGQGKEKSLTEVHKRGCGKMLTLYQACYFSFVDVLL